MSSLRDGIFCGIGNQGKSANHLAFDHIVVSPSGCMLALGLQDLKIIPMIRDRFDAGLVPVRSFLDGLGSEGAQGALSLAPLCLPVETILLSLCAREGLGVFEEAVAVPVGARIFPLCIHVGQADLDGAEFVSADPAVQDLMFALLRIEEPSLPLS